MANAGPNLKLRKLKIQPAQMFGDWKALEEAPNGKSNERRWRVRCVCGTIAIRAVTSLVRGISTNCGCKRYVRGDPNHSMKIRSAKLLIIKQNFGKVCGTCLERKPLAEFNKRKHSGDKHDQNCRDCSRKLLMQSYNQKYRPDGKPRKMGMKRKVVIPAGHRFHHWTVIEERGYVHGLTRSFLVKCVCGREAVKSIDELRRGKTKSCGCQLTGRVKMLHERKRELKEQKKTCNKCFQVKSVIEFAAKRIGRGKERQTVRSDNCTACEPPKRRGRQKDFSWHLQQVADVFDFKNVTPPPGALSWSGYKKRRLKDAQLQAAHAEARKKWEQEKRGAWRTK